MAVNHDALPGSRASYWQLKSQPCLGRPWLRRNVWRRQSVAAMMTSGQHHVNEYTNS